MSSFIWITGAMNLVIYQKICYQIIIIKYIIEHLLTRHGFNYKDNKLYTGTPNLGDDGYIYFCVINPTNNTVVPVLKLLTKQYNRINVDPLETYTTYIVK